MFVCIYVHKYVCIRVHDSLICGIRLTDDIPGSAFEDEVQQVAKEIRK